ncbi:MAG: hypothetical protein EOO38_31640, partial [Cytophagaceae bacterium]
LTQQQVAFFNTFGFLKLPALMRDDIEEITSEFEAVFTDKGVRHEKDQRTCIVPFADSRAKLCALLDDPRIEGAAASILGEDFNYLGSDGNYYVGDTNWHSDGFHRVGRYIKIAFYLDPVRESTGALRVIPTTHHVPNHDASKVYLAPDAHSNWGIEGAEVPCVALESQPGDVLMFDHNLMHAAYGGSNQRRMFTLNLCKRVETEDEFTDLKGYIASNARFWIDHMHGPIMRETATASRQVHLQQVIDNEGHLAKLSAEARAAQVEPARG